MMHTVSRAWLLLGMTMAAGCVNSELEVPANHPGHPQARSGKIQSATALSSAYALRAVGSEQPDANTPAANDEHSDHQHGAQPAKPSESAPANAAYTCPMHPEIVRKEPGKCPICGMKLVPKKDAK